MIPKGTTPNGSAFQAPEPQPQQRQLRDEWWTPDEAFADLSARYGPFDLDVAASALNTKCARFYTADDHALTKPWHGVVWCNPPYRNLINWVLYAWNQVDRGNAERVVMLLPSHTATEWFHFALEHGKVEFIKGKLKFGGAKGVPFTGSVVVVFDALAATDQSRSENSQSAERKASDNASTNQKDAGVHQTEEKP